jgi:phage gpG-like protein
MSSYLETKDRTAKLLKQLSNLAKQQVLVGIPGGSERSDGELSNAQIGYIQDQGSPAANIPARPFMTPGIEAAQERITAKLQKDSKALLDGDLRTANESLNAAGLIAVSSIQNKITEGDFEPLAASTIAKRKAEGNDSGKPLTVTGQLRNSITYVIVVGQEGSE